jgi:hypothetical protein
MIPLVFGVNDNNVPAPTATAAETTIGTEMSAPKSMKLIRVKKRFLKFNFFMDI